MALVVDLDGTVADNRHREDHIPVNKTRTEHWHQFNNNCDLDDPVQAVIDLVRLYMQVNQSLPLIFLTSRTETARCKTEIFLKSHFAEYDYRLIMRPEDDHRPAGDYKFEWLERLASVICSKSVFIEDNEEIHSMAKRMYPTASHLLVPSFDCTYLPRD